MITQCSPNAGQQLIAAITDGLSAFGNDADELQGATDCPDGCQVEPDGQCPHGYLSAALTMDLI